MSDQQPAADEQPVDSPELGTDANAAPQVPAGYIPENDYKELQAWNTREAQWRSEHESTVSLVQAAEQGDADAQKALADRFGWQLQQPGEDEVAEFQQQDPRVDDLVQWRESLTTEQQQAENYSAYRTDVDPQLTKLGVPETFVESVADIAYNELPAIQTPQGPMPDLEGAVKRFKEVAAMFAEVPDVQQIAQKQWRESKRAPHMSPAGREGTTVPDLSNHEGKVDYIMGRLHAEQQQ